MKPLPSRPDPTLTERTPKDERVTVLRPDDTVLLVAARPLTPEEAERIHKVWSSRLPQQVMVVDSSFRVIIHPASADPNPFRRFRLFRWLP